jgi:hypothetical protein
MNTINETRKVARLRITDAGQRLLEGEADRE